MLVDYNGGSKQRIDITVSNHTLSFFCRRIIQGNYEAMEWHLLGTSAPPLSHSSPLLTIKLRFAEAENKLIAKFTCLVYIVYVNMHLAMRMCGLKHEV